MKKVILILITAMCLTGCRGCQADYEQRRTGVRKICPTCTFVVSEGMYIAIDTAKQPNCVYRVSFCSGGFYYNAWDVDHLTKIQ